MAFKKTSALLNIGGSVNLVDGSTVASKETLPLSTLDREIFVVTDYQIQMAPFGLDLAAGGTVTQSVAIMKTKSTLGNISDPNTIAIARERSDQGGAANLGAAIIQRMAEPTLNSVGSSTDYIAIVATPDFQVVGSLASTSGGLSGSAYVRITGFRAVATADLYAALVTEELNQ